MNGYEMMADSYRQLVKQGKIDKETADKEIRIYDFLATCDTEDICRMVDSSAFNDITPPGATYSTRRKCWPVI